MSDCVSVSKSGALDVSSDLEGCPLTLAGTTFPHSSVDSLQLVFHVNIFLLAILAFFTLLSLPQAVVRFSRLSGWWPGLVLYHVNADRSHTPSPRRPPLVHSETSGPGSQESHTLNSHTYLMRNRTHDKEGTEEKDLSSSSSAPSPHMRHWMTLIYPVSRVLQFSLFPDKSIGQLLLLLVYFSILLYASLYKSSLFTDPARTGFVAMSQIPIVFALGTKFNLVGILIGTGYQKLNYLHRFAGRLLAIAVNIHTLGYVYEWTAAGTFMKNLKEPAVAWGFVATLAADVLVFLSTSLWRQTAYNVFFVSHVMGYIVFLVAVCYHMPVMIPYVFAASGIYGLDLLIRLIKTRMCTARIRPMPELGLTRVEVPQLNAGWRAGQHVRLRVLSSMMGWWGWTEVHPFTIASVSRDPEGLILLCKKTGDWTGRLYGMAKVAGYEDGGLAPGRDVRVMLEGPYGGPGHCLYASYSGAMLVVGGSGISYALAVVEELIQKDLDGSSRVKSIEVVWAIQDPASLTPIIPQFAALLQQSIHTNLRISCFYTRASTFDPSKVYYPPGLTLSCGRPKLHKILDAILDCTLSYHSNRKSSRGPLTGIVIGVCGPGGLAAEVNRVANAVDPRRRKIVKGIEVHEEVFGW